MKWSGQLVPSSAKAFASAELTKRSTSGESLKCPIEPLLRRKAPAQYRQQLRRKFCSLWALATFCPPKSCFSRLIYKTLHELTQIIDYSQCVLDSTACCVSPHVNNPCEPRMIPSAFGVAENCLPQHEPKLETGALPGHPDQPMAKFFVEFPQPLRGVCRGRDRDCTSQDAGDRYEGREEIREAAYRSTQPLQFCPNVQSG